VCGAPGVTLSTLHSFIGQVEASLKMLSVHGATHEEDAGHPDGRCGEDVLDKNVPTTDELFTLDICQRLEHLEQLTLTWMTGSVDMVQALPDLKVLHLKEFDFGGLRKPAIGVSLGKDPTFN